MTEIVLGYLAIGSACLMINWDVFSREAKGCTARVKFWTYAIAIIVWPWLAAVMLEDLRNNRRDR